MNESGLPEIVTDLNASSPRLSSASSSIRRAKNSEMTPIWVLLGILGVAGMGYVLGSATRKEPAEAAPVASAVREPEPEPVRKPAVAPRRAPSPPRPAVASRPAAPTVVIEETVVETPKKMVDPIEGFDNGQAFDNPPSPGRYGRRSSGLVPPMNPTPGRPPQ